MKGIPSFSYNPYLNTYDILFSINTDKLTVSSLATHLYQENKTPNCDSSSEEDAEIPNNYGHKKLGESSFAFLQRTTQNEMEKILKGKLQKVPDCDQLQNRPKRSRPPIKLKAEYVIPSVTVSDLQNKSCQTDFEKTPEYSKIERNYESKPYKQTEINFMTLLNPQEINKLKQEIDSLKCTIEKLTKENSELRNKQPSSHDKTEKEIQLYKEINELKRKLNSQTRGGNSGEVATLKSKIETLLAKNCSLVNKISELKSQKPPIPIQNLTKDNHRIKLEKEQDIKEIQELKKAEVTKMKEEWSKIYTNLTTEVTKYKEEIGVLENNLELSKQENENIIALLNQKELQMKKTELDIQKKLGKRELECSALWDTIRDIHKGNAEPTNAESLEKLFTIRALEIKAKRKVFK
ncbi:unnamed protein product [Moneuplotes crassus]|uniref:Uncharacterized protein n=1 Tax=Euplotes crassus TaxID=5936 RepID=A0AAD1U7J2_EUPCR|nr:unnamed protein product [Moneuplotes crassus]